MKRTLILVDIQNDFLQGGALAVPDGDLVVPVANRLMDKFDLVVATQDWHPADHGSFASQYEGKDIGDMVELNGIEQILWPDHCVQNTIGAAFAPELNRDGIMHVVQKGINKGIDSYSGFFDNDHKNATGLGDYLRQQGTDDLYIMGLATDYCVKFTALDARQLGFSTTLIIDGVRGVELNRGDCGNAIQEMRNAGVKMISMGDV